MMNKLQELKNAFEENKTARILVYIAALIMIVPNTSILIAATQGQAWAWLMMVPTAAITLVMYYLSDGISVFMIFVNALSKVAQAFTAILSTMLCWVPFFGVLLAIVIPLIVRVSFILGGLMFAYMLPGIFVPALHLIVRACHRFMENDVDYDEVYDNVVNEIEE